MKVWNRVITSIKRRMSQTLTMFFVVFILGNLLFAAIAVRQTSAQVENNLRVRVPSSIRISENIDKHSSSYEHERLLELIDEIAKDPRINDVIKITLLQGANNLSQDEYGNMSYSYETLICMDDELLLENVGIIEGRNLTKEELKSLEYKIILPEHMNWQYQVGDIYPLEIYDYTLSKDSKGYVQYKVQVNKTINFEVIGFTDGFSYNNQGAFYENTNDGIISAVCANEIRKIQSELLNAHSLEDKDYFNENMRWQSWNFQLRVGKIVLGIQGIDTVDEFETKIKKSEKYVNSSFVLETSANDFRYIQAPLENLKALTNVTMISSTILVIVLLGLVSILFVRNRTKEIGILMSLGERKTKLFTQFILEILLVGLLSATCAMVSGNKLGSFISNEFMRIQIDAEAEIEYGEDNKGAITQLDMLEEYNVELNGEYILTIYGASFAILLLSSLVPMAFVLKTNPKKVLL